MGELVRGRPALALRLPRWIADETFDAAVAGMPDEGWPDQLPAPGLRALFIPLVSLAGWAALLWGVTRIW